MDSPPSQKANGLRAVACAQIRCIRCTGRRVESLRISLFSLQTVVADPPACRLRRTFAKRPYLVHLVSAIPVRGVQTSRADPVCGLPLVSAKAATACVILRLRLNALAVRSPGLTVWSRLLVGLKHLTSNPIPGIVSPAQAGFMVRRGVSSAISEARYPVTTCKSVGIGLVN
jgi:hypothetical protein